MKQKFKYMLDLFFSKEMGILPAGLAFSFFFAIIPIISFIFYIATSINFSMDAIQRFMQTNLQSGIVDLLQPVFIEDFSISSLITLVFGLIVTINGCSAITIACNTIYDVDNAPYYIRLLKAVVLAIIVIVVLAFIVIVPLLGNSFIRLLGTFGTFVSENEFLINVVYIMLELPVSLLVIYGLVTLLFLIAPDKKMKPRHVYKGSIFTTFAWLVSTIIFSYYINNVARYDLVYGNLANIVILLFWIYILTYTFTIGIVINRDTMNASIEKTNTIKLEEIRKKVKHKEDNVKK